MTGRRFIRHGAGTVFGAVLFAMLHAAMAATRIGIMTDTHVGAYGKASLERLEGCYRLFKEKKVDYIFNLGDIADVHSNAYYRSYAAVRAKVYPEGLPPETYVFATHDRFEFPNPKGDKEFTAAYADLRRELGIGHDRYHRFEIEGCTFLLYPQARDHGRVRREVDAECAAHPGRPLFVLDHVPPFDTIENSVNGGKAVTRRAFDPHPEVIVLTGHVHGSLAHEGKIWQDQFTVLGFGTTKEIPGGGKGSWYAAVMELDREKAVIRRYDIETGAEVRPDDPWTLRFPYDPKTAPYRREVRVAGRPEPAFASGAQLVLAPVGEPLDRLDVTFPAAATPDVSRYRVEIQARGKDGGAWTTRSVVRPHADFTRPPAERRKTFTVKLSSAYFNANETVRIAVAAEDYYGRVGRPLVAEFTVGTTAGWRTVARLKAKTGEFLPVPKNRSGWYVFADAGFADLPAKTPCRLVMDLESDLSPDHVASFDIRGGRDGKALFTHFYAPPGRTERRYVQEFRRGGDRTGPFGLIAEKSHGGRLRFNEFRVECRQPVPDGADK